MRWFPSSVSKTTSCMAAAVVLLAACGAKPKPAQPPQAASTAPSNEPPPKVEPDGPTPEERMKFHEREFVLACLTQTPGADEYCGCAFQQYKKTLAPADFDARQIAPSKLTAAQAAVAAACPIPEEFVKAGYVTNCMANRVEVQPYCECTWGEFRKQFSSAELSTDSIVRDPRFVADRPAVVKTCDKKMPEATAKKTFLHDCQHGMTELELFCGCAWKEARKLASPAEIEANLYSFEKLKAATDSTCAKLKPKPKPAPIETPPGGLQLEEPHFGR